MAYGYPCDCLDEVTCDCGKCPACGACLEECDCWDDDYEGPDDWDDGEPTACEVCGMDEDQCVCGICPDCGEPECDCGPRCPACASADWLPGDECPDCGWMPGDGETPEDTGEDDMPF